MNLFVDTSAWSLALRRDRLSDDPVVKRLRQALDGGEPVFTTGLVLQELLQGFNGPTARGQILDRFSVLPFVVPDRADYVAAADLRNRCCRQGIQIGTIDALLARLCSRHDLVMLSTDRDFALMAAVAGLNVWTP